MMDLSGMIKSYMVHKCMCPGIALDINPCSVETRIFQLDGLYRSMPLLLMPKSFVPPGHQHPWYWLCRINGSLISLSSTWADLNYLHHLIVDKLLKMQIMSLSYFVCFKIYSAWQNEFANYDVEVYGCTALYSYYTPASTKLKGGYTGFTLSICPSVDRIVSTLYL